MKLKCIIVDDEYRNIQMLEHFVSKDEDLTLSGTFLNPLEALVEANLLSPDIIFLDLNMPQLDGADFINQTISTAKIIITTALLSNLKGLDISQVAGYLLKPFPFERFAACLSSVKARISLD